MIISKPITKEYDENFGRIFRANEIAPTVTAEVEAGQENLTAALKLSLIGVPLFEDSMKE